MILVICEKPLIAQAIADILPGKSVREKSRQGVSYIRNGDYCLVFTAGHALTLLDPEDYDESYKKWDRATLPMFFPNWKVKPSEDKKTIVATIGNLLKSANMVINAGDIDDEGQRLVDEVIEYFNYKGPVKRIRTNDLSPKAMQKALASLEDNKLWYPLGLSSYARSVGDKMVGYNATRFFTILNNTLLTVGRVQTPTLGLVVNRDKKIKAHIKEKYYELYADVNVNNKLVKCKYNHAGTITAIDSDGRIISKSDLDNVLTNIKGKTFAGEVKKKEESESAPLPFNLNKLNLYCSSKFGYDPQKVMDITQKLREEHRAITYNRSDCQYLTMEQFAEAPQVISSVLKNIPVKANVSSLISPQKKSKCFDDSKVSAHTAIIPTDVNLDIKKLSEPERNVYFAICLYYLAQFMPVCKKNKTLLNMPVGTNGAYLNATSTDIVEKGYRMLINPPEKDAEPNDLSGIPEGKYSGTVKDGNVEERETAPPRKYTKATLTADMSCVVKYVDDPEIKRILLEKDEGKEGESGSIGTGATRAKIVDQLVKRGFLEEDGKYVVSTEKGQEFYSLLPDEIKKVDMTAHWWTIQEDIKTGKATPQVLFDDILNGLRVIMDKTYTTVTTTSDKESLGTCPLCGRPVVEGKKNFYCSGYKGGCKFSIWKEGDFGVNKVLKKSNKTLKASHIKTMLKNKEHKVLIKGLISEKTGKPYDAFVGFEQKGDYTNLVFEGFAKKRKTKGQ